MVTFNGFSLLPYISSSSFLVGPFVWLSYCGSSRMCETRAHLYSVSPSHTPDCCLVVCLFLFIGALQCAAQNDETDEPLCIFFFSLVQCVLDIESQCVWGLYRLSRGIHQLRWWWSFAPCLIQQTTTKKENEKSTFFHFFYFFFFLNK